MKEKDDITVDDLVIDESTSTKKTPMKLITPENMQFYMTPNNLFQPATSESDEEINFDDFELDNDSPKGPQ